MAVDTAVPRDRPVLSYQDIKVGKPVRAQTWLDIGRLTHWVSGRGQVLVPQHRVAMVIDGVTESMRFYTPRSGRALWLYVSLDLRSITEDADAVGTISINGNAAQPFSTSTMQPQVGMVLLADEVSGAPSRAEQEITIAITSDTSTGGVAVRVESVAVWELPRAALDASITAECATSLDSLFPRRPIYYSTAESASAVIRAVHEMTVTTPLRRIGHIARWGYPLVINGVGGIPLTVSPYRLVPRKEAPGDTTRTVRCRVYASDPGAVGQVRLVGGTAGAGSWANLVSGGWSDPAEVDIDCEDQSTADGTPAGGYDTVAIQVQTDGVSAVDVYGWCVYEYT